MGKHTLSLASSFLLLLLLFASGSMFVPKAFGAEPVGSCWNDCSTDPRWIPNCAPGCGCVGTNTYNHAGVCIPTGQSFIDQDINKAPVVYCVSHRDCTLHGGRSTTASFCFRPTGSAHGFCS